MKVRGGMVLLFCVVHFFCSCGRHPSGIEPRPMASLKVSARLVAPASLAKGLRVSQTTWDSLIVEVSAADMKTSRKAFRMDRQDGMVGVALQDIPSGDNRYVEVWTVDAAGDIIHGKSGTAKTFKPNEVVTVELVLQPVCGSIYISLYDYPTVVDSVIAVFEIMENATLVRSIRAAEKKSTRNFLALDKIPYGARGVLTVAGIGAGGDTVAVWRKKNFEFTGQNLSLEASFVDVGQISLNVMLAKPGVTVISGKMSLTDSLGKEQGPLVITEIMYYGSNDSDYIEIYNPSAVAFDDTLKIDHEGTIRSLGKIAVPSGSYLIVANKAPSWNCGVPVATVSLALSSTGNMIALKSSGGRLMDYVLYATSSSEGLEWPARAAARSIELDSLPAGPEYNNFGGHWKTAKSPIGGSTTHWGSPGK
jgi:hypothetical protein